MQTPNEIMEILTTVKFRCNILYSDELIDKDIQAMIDECREYLINAGVSEAQLEGSPLAITAYSLWRKMSRTSSPLDITNHPVLLSCICQLRNKIVKPKVSGP